MPALRRKSCGLSPGGLANYAALLGSALWALPRNKMRSLLTVLGIAIAIAAVICVVAIGPAGQTQVEQQLNSLGDNFGARERGVADPLYANRQGGAAEARR